MSAEVLVTLFLPAALMVIMFGMGLGLVGADFRRVLVEPKAVTVGLIGQLLVLPALGFLLCWVAEFPPALAVGTVLLTACPGGATSNLFSKLGRGDVALSVTLTALSGLVTIATIPLLANLGIAVFGGDDLAMRLPVLQTIGKVALVVVVPVGAGMWARYRLREDVGTLERLERRVTRLSVLLLAVIVVGASVKEGPRVLQSVADVGVWMVLLSVLGMSAGFALGRIARLGEARALTLALEVGMQNAALAIGIALTMPGGTAVAVPAIVYGLWAYTPCALCAWWGNRRLRPAGPAARAAGQAALRQ